MSRTLVRALRIGAIFGIVISPLALWFIVAFVWKIPIHNFNLWRLERNFHAIASRHPAGSKLLQTNRYIGGLYPGSSYSCNYFVGEFRSDTRQEEAIMQAYSNLFIASFQGVTGVPVEVRFSDDEGFFDHHPWYAWREKLARSFDLSAAQDTIYLVFASQKGYPPGGDIRCN